MKKTLKLVGIALFIMAGSGCLTGCIAPDYSRLIADNKDAHIEVRSIYGTVIVDTRAEGSTNPMPIQK